MKLTKARLQKVFHKINTNTNQTRKKFKNKKVLHHTNTFRNRKQFNLHNTTLRHM